MIKKELSNDNTMTKVIPYNLQFFATSSDDDKGSLGPDDDSADEETDEDDEDVDKAKKGTGADDKTGKKKEKTFTQSEVNRMMSKEKKQGRNSVLKEFGFDEKSAKDYMKWKKSQMSDDEKKVAEKAETDRKIAEAEEKAQKAEVKATAMQMGIKKEFVDDVVILAMSKLKDGADIETAVSEIKTKYPIYTDEIDEDNKKSTGKKGTGKSLGKNRSKDKKEETGSFGKRLAASRKTVEKKNNGSNFF